MEFYQGEIRRLNRESQRLDSYANWAFLITGTIITIGFSFWVGVIGKFYNPQYKNYGIPLQGLPITEPLHWIFPLGISLMFIICFIDSRKYRFFLLFRARVNLTLEHYIKPKLNGEDVNIRCIFRKHLKKYIEMSSSWEEALPKEFGFWRTLAIRMFRVYGWLIFLLLFAWLLGLAGAFGRIFFVAFWEFFVPFIRVRGIVFWVFFTITSILWGYGLRCCGWIRYFKEWIKRFKEWVKSWIKLSIQRARLLRGLLRLLRLLPWSMPWHRLLNDMLLTQDGVCRSGRVALPRKGFP